MAWTQKSHLSDERRQTELLNVFHKRERWVKCLFKFGQTSAVFNGPCCHVNAYVISPPHPPPASWPGLFQAIPVMASVKKCVCQVKSDYAFQRTKYVMKQQQQQQTQRYEGGVLARLSQLRRRKWPLARRLSVCWRHFITRRHRCPTIFLCRL